MSYYSVKLADGPIHSSFFSTFICILSGFFCDRDFFFTAYFKRGVHYRITLLQLSRLCNSKNPRCPSKKELFVKKKKITKERKATNKQTKGKNSKIQIIYNHKAIRGRLCSVVSFAQNHANGQGWFLSSTGDVCLCGHIYQQTSSHAIIWRPQEALISGGEK